MSTPKQNPWWAKEEPAASPAAPRFRGVAYYRHSARDRQENSVAIQQELVQKWAKENGVDIIHEFADRGKSGLTAEGRDAFNDMMENWVKKRKDFDFVLCLDVSRWGRFQDIDLSATYSAECKTNGKQVIYTTLGMPRPDDPLYPVYVQFERFRAAQYSKELSAKVFHGCIKIAQQGYWAGGKAPFGFDRLLLDERRNRLHVLTHGQKKSIQNQRVTLTLGPDDQVTIVRRIFDEFIAAARSMEEIAARLNADGLRSAMGGPWNVVKIRRILTNIMYAGTLVYNKTTSKLKTPTRRNPVDQWIRTAGAIDPLVDQAIFDRAQEVLAQVRLRYAPETMLQHLERLHRELDIPVLYVSHSMDEVVRLADHLVLMEQGRVIASGALRETLSRLDLPTAHFDDAGAVIEATVAQQDETYHLTRLDFEVGSLWVSRVEQPFGTRVRARVLARDVSIATQAPHGSSINNILNARIEEICDERPDKVIVRMKVGIDAMLLSRITRRSRDLLALSVGMEVYAQVKSVALMA